MKKKIKLISVLFIGIIFFIGCEKDEPVDNPNQIEIDINGVWTGHLLMDASGSERTSDSSYVFDVVQNVNLLTGSLTIPEEFGVSSPIVMSGEINADSTLTMSGNVNNIEISIYGIIEDFHSMQLAIVGIEEQNQLIFLKRTESSPVTFYLNNDYKLKLKIGEAGQGRSVILIHGMNDNSETWNTMVDYLENRGINKIIKATGTLNLPTKSQNDIVFNVSTVSTPSIAGTAIADVKITESPLSSKLKIFTINVKSTTISGVNRFEIGGSDVSYKLNTSTSIITSNSSINISLLYGENAVGNVWTFQYDWKDYIYNNAIHLRDSIDNRQAKGDITTDPIIIAHSMGGLVARRYIVETGDFYRLVTLGTPHLGSKLADVVPFGNYVGTEDLHPGSDLLNYLNGGADESYRSKYWLLNGRAGTYRSGICYKWHSPEPTNVEKAGYAALDKPNDGMVPTSSARFTGNDDYDGDDNVHRVNTFEWIDHKMLNRDDRICKWVTEFIMEHQN